MRREVIGEAEAVIFVGDFKNSDDNSNKDQKVESYDDLEIEIWEKWFFFLFEERE